MVPPGPVSESGVITGAFLPAPAGANNAIWNTLCNGMSFPFFHI